MPCSAVTLSLATITAIVAVALLAIAFSTDNWLYIDVKRAQIHQVSSTVTLALSTVVSLLPFLKHHILITLFNLLVCTCAYGRIKYNSQNIRLIAVLTYVQITVTPSLPPYQ